jgi:hypothetical protein
MNEEKKAARHPTGRIERRNIPEHEAAWEGRRHLTRPPSQSESESPSEPDSSEPRGRLAGLRASPSGGTRPPPPRVVVAGGIAGGREQGEEVGAKSRKGGGGGGNFKILGIPGEWGPVKMVRDSLGRIRLGFQAR